MKDRSSYRLPTLISCGWLTELDPAWKFALADSAPRTRHRSLRGCAISTIVAMATDTYNTNMNYPWDHPQEWNFASEHPDKREPANEHEQRIHMKLYGGCLHTLWTRTQYTDGNRDAKCDKCGSFVYLGHDKTEWETADPVKSDREVRAMFHRLLPNFRYDDVVANKVFRDMESAGWHCMIHSVGEQFACSMTKGGERFVSTAHKAKPAAITEAAGLVLKGKWPR